MSIVGDLQKAILDLNKISDDAPTHKPEESIQRLIGVVRNMAMALQVELGDPIRGRGARK